MTNEFHWRDGWYFERTQDGGVRVRNDAIVEFVIPASEWPSIVAAVSSQGSSGDAYRLATDLHNNGGGDELRGAFACPICGKNTPHHHTSDEAKQNRRPTIAAIIADCREAAGHYRKYFAAGMTVSVESVADIYERLVGNLERAAASQSPAEGAAADVIERVARENVSDPATDDLTVPLAIKLAEVEAERDKWHRVAMEAGAVTCQGGGHIYPLRDRVKQLEAQVESAKWRGIKTAPPREASHLELLRLSIEEQYRDRPTGCGTSFGEILCWEIHSRGMTFVWLAEKWGVGLATLGELVWDHCKRLESVPVVNHDYPAPETTEGEKWQDIATFEPPPFDKERWYQDVFSCLGANGNHFMGQIFYRYTQCGEGRWKDERGCVCKPTHWMPSPSLPSTMLGSVEGGK